MGSAVFPFTLYVRADAVNPESLEITNKIEELADEIIANVRRRGERGESLVFNEKLNTFTGIYTSGQTEAPEHTSEVLLSYLRLLML